jgi:hypothetical protein
MQTNQLKNYLRVLYKQGLFTGDLNPVQQFCLNWALIDEREDISALEEERMKYTILAGQPEMYRKIFVEQEKINALQEDEWRSLQEVPEEEMAEVFSQIDAWQSQREEF